MREAIANSRRPVTLLAIGRVTACIDFASEDAFQRFKDLLTRYTW